MFRRFLVILLVVFLLGLLVVGLLLVWAYHSSQQVPEFYRQALKIEPAKAADRSDRMLQRATALASEVKEKPKWHAVFTADEINGWLAVDLVRNHARSLPPDLHDPRVSIAPGELTVACQVRRGGFKSVLSLTVDAYLSAPGKIAVEFKRARAGRLPIPLGDVLEQISAAARRATIPIEWGQKDGNPVVVIPLDAMEDEKNRVIHVEKLTLEQDEIYIAGTTERRTPLLPPGEARGEGKPR
jgi:uncharacterized protein YpmS